MLIAQLLATLPRRSMLSLGEFSVREAERSYSYLDSGVGGLPEHKRIVQRFDAFAENRPDSDGVRFLRAAISFVKDQLGLDQDAFLFEITAAFLGCNYPTPPRILLHTEEIVTAHSPKRRLRNLRRRLRPTRRALPLQHAVRVLVLEILRSNRLAGAPTPSTTRTSSTSH